MQNHQFIGATPADGHFIYYGNYHFTLVKDGYATLQVDQEIPAPWYQYFPLDFFSEHIWPFHIEDVRRFRYKLETAQMPNLDTVLNRGQELRNRAITLGPGAPPSVETPIPAPPSPNQR
jgi:hypothetical protein